MDTLQLLAGVPIVVEPNICVVSPLTLRQVAAMGLEEYYKKINFVTLSEVDVSTILASLGIEVEEGERVVVSGYDFIVENCLQNHMFYDEFRAAMRMVIGETVSILEMGEEKFILVGDPMERRQMDKESFKTFQNIIRAQNNMDIEHPLTDAEKRMKEKFDKNRELVEKTKKREGKDNDSDITFDILISSFAANANGINIINVWDLTMYAFNDQFKRMQAVEEYQNGMDLICAGADPKKIKLKHYIRNILDK